MPNKEELKKAKEVLLGILNYDIGIYHFSKLSAIKVAIDLIDQAHASQQAEQEPIKCSCGGVLNCDQCGGGGIVGMMPKAEQEIDIEMICEKVHQAYCKYHLENKGTEYWTKGDYSKLNEDGKEYDRRTVRAVLDALNEGKG